MSNIKTKTPQYDGYLNLNGKNRDSVLLQAGRAVLEAGDGVKHTVKASSSFNITPSISTRTPFNRSDYDAFRPGEAVPQKFPDIVRGCRAIYKRVGVVRQVIDLMVDFIVEDLSIRHPDPKIDALLKVYQHKIKIHETAAEFAKRTLVDGNTVIRRVTARLPRPVETQLRESEEEISAAPDLKVKKNVKDIGSREIPWRYTFLDPAGLNWKGGVAAKIANIRALEFQLDYKTISMIRAPKGEFEREVVSNMPKDIVDQVRRGETKVSLDMNKIFVGHYKKDAFDEWAVPFLYAVMPDIYFKDKLRLAETAALDGVINVIRLWKLGDHENGIFAGSSHINRLISILDANTGGGALDIVWDSMIEMQEFYPPVDKILGSEKYVQVNSDIMIGLGIPEVLLGGKGANFSNSFIQLKTIVERMETVRSTIISWLTEEMKWFCKAMDIKTLPIITFAHMDLQDENVSRNLLIQLMDRDVISVETVLERFGENYIIELERIKQQKNSGLKKFSPLDKSVPSGGVNRGGRPVNTKDVSRKTRRPKPRTNASMAFASAMDAVEMAADAVSEWYMNTNNVKNARQLTNEQKEDINAIRISVLSCITLGKELTKKDIIACIDNMQPNERTVEEIITATRNWTESTGKTPTLSQRKYIEAGVLAQILEEQNA